MEQNNQKDKVCITKLQHFILICMLFLGALLLFGMEPLVGRLLMPLLGGAAHVWLTCLMFFQAMLFIGYLYVHLFARKLGIWHLLLIMLPLVNLPFQIDTTTDPSAPLFDILVTLTGHFALPFAVLSTTAVIAQLWYTDSRFGQDGEPYPFYAASNAGSLIALLGYVFIVEPLFGLRLQSYAWTILYLVYIFVVMAAWFVFVMRPYKDRSAVSANSGEKTHSQSGISRSTYGKWLLLSSLPSALLLSVTNFITSEVGSFPLIWVAPLALYLGSFIITFRSNGGVPHFLKTLWPEFLLLSFASYLSGSQSWLAVIMNVSVLFLICLIAHGTLYEERPPASGLTNFYLTAALGGWLGGAFSSLVAPQIFKGLYDYPLLLMLSAFAFWWCCDKSYLNFWTKAPFSDKAFRTSIIGVILVLIVIIGWPSLKENVIFRHRNFYGTYRIIDVIPFGGYRDGIRVLCHGATVHGSQLLNPDLRKVPTSYYHLSSGISDVFETTPSPRKIGIIGLGAGCIAAYSKQDDQITYFEIDPDNDGIARKWFTYLDDCKGRVSVVAGDGRLSILQYKGDTDKYDVIIVDAFSGGGIPTHLLTTEAIEVYKNHLAPRGLLVFHITNRYYDLQPVLKSISSALHLSGAMSSYNDHLKAYEEGSLYVALANHSRQLEPLLNRGWKRFGDDDGLQNITAWTDDYINILAALKPATILSDEMNMFLPLHEYRMPVHGDQVDRYRALHD